MPSVSTQLHYGAPLATAEADDDWCIDALSNPPEVVLNFRLVAQEMTVTDLRGAAVGPTLDTMGFEKVAAPTGVDHRALAESSPSAIERYQQETAELLRARTGADTVRFFDTTLRSKDAAVCAGSPYQSPHMRVHVDQTPRSARDRAAGHGDREREFSRFQIINVWRPLVEPVRNFPLAVCDYRSLDLAADLVATRLDFPEWLKDRESYSVKHNPNHRWHYWDSLTPDEAILFKCHDSASRDLALLTGDADRSDLLDVAWLCPHTAFLDENGPSTGHLRTSLEMRALLFYG
ncbi:CmcJ/NvfI family oxidoreductase [Streptomyces sp. NPDC059002]|uniref:CmcJ/NvfI family oxidoreductase n=1 Tax=Streptomyces sp. NPDC059002 TaxID=3346690 RepID=UPI00369A3212